MLSGATDLEKRHEPDAEGADALADARLRRAPGVRVTELDAGRTSTSCCRRPTALPGAAEPEPVGGDAQPELGLGTLPAPRALPVSRLSYTGSRPTGAAATASTSSGRCACRASSRRSRAGAAARGRASARCCAARSCTSCSSGSTSRRPARARRRRGRGADRGHGATVRPEEVADLRDMVERFAASELRERIARARRVRTELPFAFTLDAARRGRAQPAGQRRRRRARDGGRTGCWSSTTRATRSTGATPAELTAESYATQRLVYALAGLRAGAERVEVALLLPRAPRRAGGRGVRGRRRRPARGASCSSSPPAWWRAASSPPPSRTGSCAATARAGPRCAPGTSSTRSSSA